MCTLLLFIWNSNCNKFFVSRMQIMLNRWHRPTKLSIACVYWNHMQKPIFFYVYLIFFMLQPPSTYTSNFCIIYFLHPSEIGLFLKIDVSLLISFAIWDEKYHIQSRIFCVFWIFSRNSGIFWKLFKFHFH